MVALAAAHHRLAWIHPFLDGNGRVARLHTYLLLHGWGLTCGLWSPLRGYARTEETHKALPQVADEHRRGDLDGRGHLTEAGLVPWIEYTLDVRIDQVEFMARQLDVTGTRDRIRAALAFEAAVVKSGVQEEVLMPLHYLLATQGELARADFKSMAGLGPSRRFQQLQCLALEGAQQLFELRHAGVPELGQQRAVDRRHARQSAIVGDGLALHQALGLQRGERARSNSVRRASSDGCSSPHSPSTQPYRHAQSARRP